MEGCLKFRNYAELKKHKFNDEKLSTKTSVDQQLAEALVEKCFDRYQQLQFMDSKQAKIYRPEHQRFLDRHLRHLPKSYECLDSSRTWTVYWIMQAAHTLNHAFPDETLDKVVRFLFKCRQPAGGFGGGPGQYSHLATTYAAVNSLCMIGTTRAYQAIDRDSLVRFLFSVRQPDGSFRMHVGGEVDVRGAYCAISCAKLVHVPKATLAELFDKTGDWIASCQTYEGGFGGAPDLEAHGGYTFCGVAALALLNEGHKCDRQLLLKWNLQRQMSYEGGFQGRTNKQVDGCYSFWVGATVPITQALLASSDSRIKDELLFDCSALQEYILLCCQHPMGGLLDKPGKPQDLYHTCYTLSGVSIAQHSNWSLEPEVLGDISNELLPTHPLFNVPPSAVANALAYFEAINKYMNVMDEEEVTEHSNGANKNDGCSGKERESSSTDFSGSEESASARSCSSSEQTSYPNVSATASLCSSDSQ